MNRLSDRKSGGGVPASPSGHEASPSAAISGASSRSRVPNAALCSFCEFPATCMVSDESDIFDACPRCFAAWERDPGFQFEFGLDQARVFVALMGEVGAYIYHNNGPTVAPLKRSWNKAFNYAKAAASAIEARSDATGTGAAEGESAATEGGDARPQARDDPMLTADEEAELVERINANPNLHPLAQDDDAELVAKIERLHDWLAETQMLAHKWMVAHDKLQAGKPYDLPKPADLPDAITALLEERDALQAALDNERATRLSVTTPDTTVLVERVLVEFVQAPRWSENADPPEDNADWRAGYEAAQSNLRECLKPWWPLGGFLALASTANPTGAPE